jgi:biopolymer transport protein ExbD
MHKLSPREKAEKERKNPTEEDPEFQIAPMIDILLVLLVFFMSISSTEVLQANREISLPVAADGRSAEKNPSQVIINVVWDTKTDVGGIEVDDVDFDTASMLVPRLQKAIEADPMVRVLVRADRAVRYEYLRTVLKAVGEAQVQTVTFSVVDKESSEKAAETGGSPTAGGA